MSELKTLHQMISRSVSPYHCVQAAAAQLESAGYREISLQSNWRLTEGGNYYLKAYDSTLIAFHAGKDMAETPKIRIAAAHTDWPCLKLKPHPEVSRSRYGRLNAEIYGGPIFHTWMDRPLSLAGKVSLAAADPMNPATVFVDFHRPMLTIPNLAIHMNREVNSGMPVNAQKELLPLFTVLTDQIGPQDYFLNALSKEAGVSPQDILDYEIFVYNAEAGTLLGLHEEFYSAPRLDNLTSVQACISGLTGGQSDSCLSVIALYDNEEVGSHTKQGAASALLEKVLEKAFLSLGYDRESFLTALFQGFFLSVDTAHALHPNYPEKCDIKNQIVLGDGIAIKQSASQSYATDSTAAAVIEGLCRSHQIPCRRFSNRSDIRGGSTIGSISSCLLTMRAVDIGIPLLAMHSAREVMGTADQEALVSLIKSFFNA